MPYLLFDVVILLFLLVFALWGAKRGFVLSLCGLVAVVVAILGASLLSRFLAPPIAQWLTPSLTTAFAGFFEPDAQGGAGFLWNLMEKALADSLQALPGAAAGVSPEAASAAALAGIAAEMVAQALSFFLAFLIILLAWTILSHALDLVSKLPGLNLLNKTGGLLIGALKGAIVLFVLAWILRLVGSPFPPEALAESPLLRFFLTANPMALLMQL